MSRARARLRALAAAAGYGPDTLALIADAALPQRPARGERLAGTDIAHVTTAVEVLAQAGHPASALPVLVAHYRDRYWREQFWQRQLRTACLRYRHSRFYGLSACEADHTRLADAGRRGSRSSSPATGTSPTFTMRRAA